MAEKDTETMRKEAESLRTGSRIRAQQTPGEVRWGSTQEGARRPERRAQARCRAGAPGEGGIALGRALRCSTAQRFPVGASRPGCRGWGGGQTNHRAHAVTPRTGRAAPRYHSDGLMATTGQDSSREHAWGHQVLKLHLRRNSKALRSSLPSGGSECAG